MVRGEEKQFEITVDQLLEYTKSIKVSLVYFIQRIENEGETMDWTQVLDSFTSMCGQINTLLRYTRDHKLNFIENRVVLPILVSPDPDDELVKLTEGRVQMVNHEMVPDYLRTKPDPEIEEFEKSLQNKATTIQPDAAQRQATAMHKLLESTEKAIKANMARADEISRQLLKPATNINDTNELLQAVSSGKNLKIGSTPIGRVGPADPAMMDRQREAMQKINQAKAPELKTNIRAGT